MMFKNSFLVSIRQNVKRSIAISVLLNMMYFIYFPVATFLYIGNLNESNSNYEYKYIGLSALFSNNWGIALMAIFAGYTMWIVPVFLFTK